MFVPETKKYQAYRSDSSGSVMVIVIRKHPLKKRKYDLLVALVDLWKVGLKDCYGAMNMSEVRTERFLSKAESSDLSFYPIPLSEAKWLIKEGIRIRDFLGIPIPSKCKKLLPIVGDLESIKITGSIYKCFNCEKGDLDAETDEFIKKIALKEYREGIVGTPDEMEIYFLCDKCKKAERST